MRKRKNVFQDLTGQRFERLLVTGISHKRGRVTYFKVLCECGAEKSISGQDMKSGRTRSCGCMRREICARMGAKSQKHGLSGHPLYHMWHSMMQRCYNPKTANYHYYGARGIQVCERWHSFKNFVEDMHPRPVGLELDRIDNDGNYSPGNCRWVSKRRNKNNRQFNRAFQYRGREYTIKELAVLAGKSYGCMYGRLANQGLTAEEAILKV